MNDDLHRHHRATLEHLAELKRALLVAIGYAQKLADEAPASDAFNEALACIARLDERIRGARRLAVALNHMLPTPNVRLVPPTPHRYPTPRRQRVRSWARRVRMPAVCFDTPT